MYRLLPLLADLGLGIITFVWVSIAYGQTTLIGFLLAVVLVFMPDLDALPEISKRGRLAASKDNPTDHREMLHKPLLWLALTGMFWMWSGYYGAIAFFVILMHFVHDSVLTGWGVPWFAPFSQTRIKFFVDETNKESLARENWIRTWGPEELTQAIVQYGYEDWIERLYLRPTVVSIIEYGIFGTAVIILAWHLLA